MRSILMLGVLLVVVSSCSLLVNPNEARLNGSNNDASVRDGVVVGSDVAVLDSHPIGDVTVMNVPCATDCNDNVACTNDRCDTSNGTCIHAADNALCPVNNLCDPTAGCTMRPCTGDDQCSNQNVCDGPERCDNGHCVAGTPMQCDDMMFCDGAETCNPMTGCQPGAAPSCDDNDPCTTDSCAASANGGACAHAPVDADGDTYPATSVGGTACAGGTDCNDSDPSIHPGAIDLCDGVDRNCDMHVMNPPCGTTNTDCTTATAIQIMTGTMTLNGQIGSAGNDVTTCGAHGGTLWYRVTFPANQDLEMYSVRSGNTALDTVLDVREQCTSADEVCNDDASASDPTFGSRIWVRGDAAGFGTRTIQVALSARSLTTTGSFTLTLTLTATPFSLGCLSTAFLDLSRGGAVLGHMPNHNGSLNGSCSPRPRTNPTEEIYTFTGNFDDSVSVSAEHAGTATFVPSLYVRDGCGSGNEEACANGNPITLAFGATGDTQYVVVDNAAPGAAYVVELIAP